MKLFRDLIGLCLLVTLATHVTGRVVGSGQKQGRQSYKRAPLQSIVTWDEHSIFVRGERVLFWSGEFHPFRLPVPGLWLDVFQKVKAMGFTGVSFYVDWALLEGQQGHFRATGIFSLNDFFKAAVDTGIYLLARPGPYINAEASGGGFPGWLQRIPGSLRTTDPSYLNATQLYVTSISTIIEQASITNGGPVILFQPENEYSLTSDPEMDILAPNEQYMQEVEDQYRNAGITLPYMNNDAIWFGYNAPGTAAAVDIYGFDWYPLRFDCSDPYTWPGTNFAAGMQPTLRQIHETQSPSTPFSIPEMQGGSSTYWGGPGEDKCLEMTGPEFERIFYKANLGFGIATMNLYMIYGGTNWGNLGHPGGYTSYDYGAVIAENLLVDREKYSELKLITNFAMAAGSTYLTATPANITTNDTYTNTEALTVTSLFAANNSTKFFILRHTDYASLATTPYKLIVPTSKGSLRIPQLTGHLTLFGRDSKIHVTDYDINGRNLLYSTAEIFTVRNTTTRTVLVVYGDIGERHELAFSGKPSVDVLEGSGLIIDSRAGTTIFNWKPSPTRSVVKLGSAGLFIYFVDRQSAYNLWVLPLASETGAANAHLVASAGYLLRNATISGKTLALSGDLNATSSLEIILGAPSKLSKLTFNGNKLDFTQDQYGVVSAELSFIQPAIKIPNFSDLQWRYHDSLPEIQPSYDDSAWTTAGLTVTPNTWRNLTTPTSLYGGDYGYTAGSLIFRGHFTATGSESTIALESQGGTAFGMSAWLNSTYLGSWAGDGASASYNSTFTVASLGKGKHYVLTVVIDHMGLDETWWINYMSAKAPRGILNYNIAGLAQNAVTWKVTGNLGGESYEDKARGPLNEGAMYAERQGWHLPAPPTRAWEIQSPLWTGIQRPGIGFYSTSFELDMPKGYAIPLSLVVGNVTTGAGDVANFRVQLFVNGYQFGKYVNNIGPQTVYPVPEGIWNYHGMNYVALTLWAMDADGIALGAGFRLQVDGVVQSGYGPIALSPMPAYQMRVGAY